MVGKFGPVAGCDRPAARPALGQRLGECAMESLPLAGQEVLVGHLLEERVAEGIVALDRVGGRRPGDEDLAADGCPQGVRQVRALHRGHAGEEVMVDPPARNGRHPDDGLGGFREGDDASEQDLPEGRRQATDRCVLAGPEQFLDEERVAIGAAMDLAGEIAGRRRTEDGRQQRLRFRLVEAAQVDPLDATATLELRKPRQERMATMELIGSDRS